MSFTTSCFIRKNTPQIRKKLEELGIEMFLDFGSESIDVSCGVYNTSKIKISERLKSSENNEPYIDCGTNEDLFLALAALRDDTDYMQWFVTDTYTYYYLKPDTEGKLKGKTFIVDLGKDYFFLMDAKMSTATIKGNYHKATPEELINHFK